MRFRTVRDNFYDRYLVAANSLDEFAHGVEGNGYLKLAVRIGCLFTRAAATGQTGYEAEGKEKYKAFFHESHLHYFKCKLLAFAFAV